MNTDNLMRDYAEERALAFPSLRGLTKEQIEAASRKYDRLISRQK
jgi:hypothetical protein